MRSVLRMCLACRQLKDRSAMLRFVKGADGVVFADTAQKADGRGAYVCGEVACLNKLIGKKLLNKVFSCKVDEGIYLAVAEGKFGGK